VCERRPNFDSRLRVGHGIVVTDGTRRRSWSVTRSGLPKPNKERRGAWFVTAAQAGNARAVVDCSGLENCVGHAWVQWTPAGRANERNARSCNGGGAGGADTASAQRSKLGDARGERPMRSMFGEAGSSVNQKH
jgi:hypothetical protein